VPARFWGVYLRAQRGGVGAGIGPITSELRATFGNPKAVIGSIEPDADLLRPRLRAPAPEHMRICRTIAIFSPNGLECHPERLNVLEHIEMDCEEFAAYHRLLQPARGRPVCLFRRGREIMRPIDRISAISAATPGHECERARVEAGFQIISLRYYKTSLDISAGGLRIAIRRSDL